jgi:hypothetical protein
MSGAAASAAPAAKEEATAGEMRLLGAAAMEVKRLGMYPPGRGGTSVQEGQRSR